MPMDGSDYAFCHPETGQPKKRSNDRRSELRPWTKLNPVGWTFRPITPLMK